MSSVFVRCASLGMMVALLAGSVARPAEAEICAVDNVPAATLLLPYFEVDLVNPRGTTTLFSVHNALDRSVLARVTLWTDHAVPTFAFDVYLTGFDVQGFNLRDLFAGSTPTTGSGVSPVGWMSAPGGAFVGCDGAIDIEVPVEHLRAAHQGEASSQFGGLCSGRAFDDRRARGYVTIDVVTECVDPARPVFPSEPGYFGDEQGAGGVAGYDNALWGEYFYVEPREDRARGDSLVRMEADRTRFSDGDRTFYGRYHGNSGLDGREPLPGAWAARTLDVPAAGAETTLVVWRETLRPPEPFTCGGFHHELFPGPSFYYEWDEEENPADPRQIPITPPFQVVFQASQLYRQFGFFDAGWITLDLNYSPLEPTQGYVSSTIEAEGRYSISSSATALDSGCDPLGCRFGGEVEITQLCVEGGRHPSTEIEVGEPVSVRSTAGGCHSRSCSYETQATCVARLGDSDVLEVQSRICLGQTLTPCLPVCDLTPSAYCWSDQELDAGVYTLRSGELELTFTVPSTVPEGGLCVGEVIATP